MESERRISRRDFVKNLGIIVPGSLLGIWGTREISMVQPVKSDKDLFQALKDKGGPGYALLVFTSITGYWAAFLATVNLIENKKKK